MAWRRPLAVPDCAQPLHLAPRLPPKERACPSFSKDMFDYTIEEIAASWTRDGRRDGALHRGRAKSNENPAPTAARPAAIPPQDAAKLPGQYVERFNQRDVNRSLCQKAVSCVTSDRTFACRGHGAR
jgi:hypothetical protein